MRSMIIAIALAAASVSAAHAETLATAGNGAGGLIVITDDVRPDDKGACSGKMLAYTFTGSGEYLLGCWVAGDVAILVEYDDGDSRLYPFELFSAPAEEGFYL